MTESISSVPATTSTAVVREKDFTLKYTVKQLPRVNLVWNAAAVVGISILLLTSLFMCSLWYSRGMGWLLPNPRVAHSSSPLTSCPQLSGWSSSSSYMKTTPMCRVVLNPYNSEMYNALISGGLVTSSASLAKKYGHCTVPGEDPSHPAPLKPGETQPPPYTPPPIICYSHQSCAATSNWEPLNPYSRESLDLHDNTVFCTVTLGGSNVFTVGCKEIWKITPFCDADFQDSVGSMLIIRGMFVGLVLFLVYSLVSLGMLSFRLKQSAKRIVGYRTDFLQHSIVNMRENLWTKCLGAWVSAIVHREGDHRVIISKSFAPQQSPPSVVSESAVSCSPTRTYMPHKPMLRPIPAVAYDRRSSYKGYSPRVGSTTATIGVSPPLRRSMSVEESQTGLKYFVWPRKITKYFKDHWRLIRLRRNGLFSGFVRRCIMAILFVGFYTVLLRCVMMLIELVPAAETPAYGVSLTEVVQLPSSDKRFRGNLLSVLGTDMHGRVALFLWVVFLGYLDVVFETFVLLILTLFGFMRPANLARVCTQPTVMTKLSPLSFLNRTRSTTAVHDDEDEHEPMAGDSPVTSSVDVVVTSAAAMEQVERGLLGSRKVSLADMQGELLLHHHHHPLPSDAATCVMVSVMAPCSTSESTKSFIAVLKSIQNLVEFDVDIFVVDCGNTREPIDHTEYVVKTDVSPNIHYIYYPEPDRTAALYWTSKFWIPQLFSAGMCGDYIYTLVTDENFLFANENAGSILPPTNYLMNNPDVKAFYIPFRENPATLGKCNWVQRLKERIQVVGMKHVCQTALDTGSFSTVQLWERNTLEMTCFRRKCIIDEPNAERGLPASLNWKENCLELLNDRGQSKIQYWVNPSATLPTYIGGKSNKQFTGRKPTDAVLPYCYELLNPYSMFHLRSVACKIVILPEVINAMFDCFRLFFIPGFFLRDPVGFGLATAILAAVMIGPYILSLIINAKYETNILKKMAILTFIYPLVFIFVTLPMRSVKVITDITAYTITTSDTDATIEEREEELRDFPPTPPHHVPHWSSIWTGN